jgi:ABC-type dipeptide/oligopeptide/nickel transport system permease component
MTDISPEVLAKVAQATHFGLKVLAAKLLALIALGMTFGLFCYAISDHSWIAYTSASTFAALIFLPSLWNARSKEGSSA